MITLASTGYELARYAAPDDYVPEAYYSSLLSKGAAYDDFTRWVFDPAHTAVEIELIPESLYSGYEMYEAQAAVSSMSVMTTSLDSVPMPGDTNSFTNVTSTASASQSSTDVTMTFSLPEDFGNYAEIFKTTNLKYVPWSVAENRMSVTGGAYIAWTDAGSSNQPVGYYIFSDADLSEQTDSDSDGYTDLREIYISDTDPDEFDQVDDDNDGMMDFYEITFFGSTAQNPSGDYDGDGLSNAEEMEYDPGYPGYIDPSVTLHSNPADADTDRDGMDDYLETVTYTFLDPNDPSDSDYDYDGLSNAEELELGTDFQDWDTDNDTLPDGIEAEWENTSPLLWNNVNADSDGDGLSLGEEYSYGTDPASTDSDGDGVGDGTEALQGSSPADAGDLGTAPDSSDIVQVQLKVGDWSPSESEIYELTLSGERTLRLHSGSYGNVVSNTFYVRRGETYSASLKHVGSNLSSPEHDYLAEVQIAEGNTGYVHYDAASEVLGTHGIIYVRDDDFPAENQTEPVHILKVNLERAGNPLSNNGYAFISSDAEMPSVEAKLLPAAAGISAEWSGQIVFDRPNRNESTPLSGSGSEWSLQDSVSINCGGKATLLAKVGTHTFTNIFHIRGFNPSEADAAAEIGDDPFYAKAMARHESGTQNGRTYLQFNEVNTLGIDYLTDLQYTPNRSSDIVGWGIYQLSIPAPSIDEVWNWKSNIAEALQRLEGKESDAQSYFNAVYRTYTNEWEDPPDSYTPSGCSTSLTALEAATIQLFNGGAVLEQLVNPYGGTNWYSSCWQFSPDNPSGQKWTFVPNSENYVFKVIDEHENN